MNELELLRKEINELRERLAKLEFQKARIEDAGRKELDELKRAFLESEKQKAPQLPFYPQHFQPPPRPYWASDIAKHFPPGTILC